MKRAPIIALAAIGLGLWIFGPADAAAQESRRDLETVLRRLEAAEARIQLLERDLSAANGTGPVAPADDHAPDSPAEARSYVPRRVTRSRISPDDGAASVERQESENAPSGQSSIGAESRDESESFEQMLKDMQARWEKQDELNDEFTKSIESKVSPDSSAATMSIGGRIHTDYWAFPGDSPGVNTFETGDSTVSPQDRFLFRRIRLHAEGEVSDNMLYKAETEFSGGNDFEIRDVYIGFKDLPYLQRLVIGNQKRPYGLDHINSSRYNIFIERPFIVESFNEDARRLGIVSYGVTDQQDWNWRYGVYNMRLIQDEGEYVSDHYQLELAGRLANTIWYDESSGGRGYAHWAISGSIAHPDGSAGGDPSAPFAPGDNRRAANEARFRHRPEARSSSRWIDTGRIAGAQWYELMGLEGVVNVGPVQVVGEYMNVWLQRDPAFGDDLFLHGGYAYASYFLTGEHMAWDREMGQLDRISPFENFFLVDRCNGGVGTGWGAWQVAVRYSYADLTDQNVFGGMGESVTLALVWYLNPNANLQLNYINGSISDRNVTDVNGLTFTGGDYDIIGARLRIDF